VLLPSRPAQSLLAYLDLQGVVAAGFAKQLGISRIYVLRDSTLGSQWLAESFVETARRIGLQIVGGPENSDSFAAEYGALAERVRQAQPGLVYWSGFSAETGGKLWRELHATLGDQVKFMGSDGIYSTLFVATAGAAAEGAYLTSTGIPASKLTGPGADWYRRYQERFQKEPIPTRTMRTRRRHRFREAAASGALELEQRRVREVRHLAHPGPARQVRRR
jgi:branched-chain amino acid transport system substrate-binding protein